MKITKLHVQTYINLRSEIKSKETQMNELKAKFMEAVRSTESASIVTSAGKITYVRSEVHRLDEEKLKIALGLTDLGAFKTTSFVEKVLVTA